MNDFLLRRRVHGAALLAALALAGCDGSPTDSGPPPAKGPQVAQVEISAPFAEVVIGRTLQLTAVAKDSAGAPVAGSQIAWSSSDTTRARVSASGVVEGVARGDVVITARSGTVTDTLTLGVVIPLRSASIGQGQPVLMRGATRQMVVSAHDTLGNPVPSPRVRWRSTNPAVATVSATGLVTAQAPGTAEIVAQIESRAVSARILVVAGWDVVVLGTLGGAGSRALGLNDRGDVVGEAQTASGEWRAFLWRDGAMVELGSPVGRSRAVAVNENREVAGVYHPGSDTTVAARPFLWRGGTMTALPVLSDPEQVYATDINNRGQVVGYASTRCPACPEGTVGSALLWEGGAVRDLGRFGGHQAYAYAIDEQGRVAGRVGPLYRSNAVLYAGGEVQTLFGGTAYDFGPGGEVVGSSNPQGASGSHVVVWQGGRTQLHWVPGRSGSVALGMDRSGRVAFMHLHFAVGTPIPPAPTVLDSDGSMYALPPLLEGSTPHRLDVITDMNLRGDIVGYGREATTGATRAFLLRARP